MKNIIMIILLFTLPFVATASDDCDQQYETSMTHWRYSYLDTTKNCRKKSREQFNTCLELAAKRFVARKNIAETMKKKCNMNMMSCAAKKASKLKAYYDQTNLKDKLIHCTLMCRVSFACNSSSAYTIGMAKEYIHDWLFGKGDFEEADLTANNRGIYYSKIVESELQCQEKCSLMYEPGKIIRY